MRDKKLVTQVTLLVVLLAVGFGSSIQAIAQDGDVRSESQNIVAGNSYDISIGKAGIYLSETLMTGTVTISREEAVKAHGGGCRLSIATYPCGNRSHLIVWQQRMLEVHVYQENGKEYPFIKGLAYVYFNLDLLTRRAWENDKDGRMSIWWWDAFNQKWVKCPTFLKRDASAPQGRLVCYLEEMGTYGLGVRQEDLVIKLIKLGIITVTPTKKP
jgi:hypothetical protein